MVIQYKKDAVNVFEAYDDYGLLLGSACVERARQPLVLTKRPSVFTIHLQGEDEAIDALLGAATAHALFLANGAQENACVRVEMQPEQAEKFADKLLSLGYAGKSAVLRMQAPVPEGDVETKLPKGLTVIRDYLNDEQERGFYLERTNALFGCRRDMHWLEEMRGKEKFARVLLVDAEGVAGEMVTYMDGESAVVENLWVHPDWRRQGAASFLLDFTRQYWLDCGAADVRLDIWSRLRPAVSMAKKLGFKPVDALIEYPYMNIDA